MFFVVVLHTCRSKITFARWDLYDINAYLVHSVSMLAGWDLHDVDTYLAHHLIPATVGSTIDEIGRDLSDDWTFLPHAHGHQLCLLNGATVECTAPPPP